MIKNLNSIVGAFFSQLFFSINHMVILILSTVIAYYVLPVEYKYLATLPPAIMQVSAFSFIAYTRKLMNIYGYKIAFFIGNLCGLIGAISFYCATVYIDFLLLLVSCLFFGIQQSYAGFLRYITADEKPCCKKTKSIAIVISASVIAAVIAPMIITISQNWIIFSLYAGTGILLIIVNTLGLWFSLLIVNKAGHADEIQNKVQWDQLSQFSGFSTGVSVSAISNSIMNMLMLTTPLAIIGCGMAVSDIGSIFQSHMIAMFIPVLITSYMVVRLGNMITVLIGLLCLSIALPFFYFGNLASEGVYFQIAMIALGIGWGIVYISGTGLISMCYCPCDSSGVQTKAEMIIVGTSSFFAIMAGYLFNQFGMQGVIGIATLLLTVGIGLILIESKNTILEYARSRF